MKISSFSELLKHSASAYSTRDAVRIRSGKGYSSISYNTLQEHAFNIAATLTERGFAEQKIAVLGENSYHWMLSYLGTVISNNVIVPIDKELTPDEISNILGQADIQAVFCSEDYIEIIQQTNFNKTIFQINSTEDCPYEKIENLIEQGAQTRLNNPTYGQNETTPDTLSTIVFTSGTTGFSKGVMLSRKNILSNVINTDDFITLKDSTLSLLPMNHTYEFTLDILLTIYQGVAICINNGIKYFQQNLQIFQPVNLVIVPLIAENLMKSVWNKIETENKTAKVNTALKISRLLLKLGIDVRHKLFKPVHQAMGGRLDSLFIGGAPLNTDIAKQLFDFGFKVNIGYGITECSPFVSGNITNNPKFFKSCGKTIPNVTAKIDNPNENGEGEIIVKGPTVMMGYYENNDATNQVLINDWFHTGDIGRLDKHNMLYITGRVKNLIVLNNGKNIYPEELENLIYKANKLVKEVIVSSSQSSDKQEVNIIAEIFPDPEITQNTNIENVQQEIKNSIELLNNDLPYFKRIVEVKFRQIEFPKTTTKKIKRY